MEEIIQILIFVGAMVIAVVAQSTKNKKKPMTASPQETLEDMFPEIEIQGEEKVEPKVQPIRSVRPQKTRNIQMVPQSQVPLQQKETLLEQGKGLCLKKKSEARRAFIYSEIFNRKY